MGLMRNENKLKVTVELSELIDHLIRNKERHEQDYKQACVFYFKKLQSSLEDLAKDASENTFRDDNYNLALSVPQNRSKDYDKYINMFKMAQEDTLEIDLYQYECFVEDNWDWISTAKAINHSYLT